MQQRRATAAVWNTSGYILAAGELGVTTDTGIIKIGDGVNAWVDLDIAFDSLYLPTLGKAADSDLLDGISAASFVQVADTSTDALADKVARRLSDGKLKATAGTATDEVVNYAQMVAADELNRRIPMGRTLTTATTLLATDMQTMILVNNTNRSSMVQLTIPTNASVPIPIGSWFNLYAFGVGGAVVVNTGITLRGDARVYGNYGVIRIVKINTDTWLVVYRSDPADAYAKCFAYMDTAVTGRSSGWQHIAVNNESYDSHNGHIAGLISGDDTDTVGKQTNRFTVPAGQAGMYKVSGMSSMICATSTASIQARILKNGTVFSGSHGASSVASNSAQALTGEKLISLAEGDYIGMQAFCSTGTWESYISENVSGGSTSWLTVERVS
jgi:hypothetical protein